MNVWIFIWDSHLYEKKTGFTCCFILEFRERKREIRLRATLEKNQYCHKLVYIRSHSEKAKHFTKEMHAKFNFTFERVFAKVLIFFYFKLIFFRLFCYIDIKIKILKLKKYWRKNHFHETNQLTRTWNSLSAGSTHKVKALIAMFSLPAKALKFSQGTKQNADSLSFFLSQVSTYKGPLVNDQYTTSRSHSYPPSLGTRENKQRKTLLNIY